MNTSMNDKDFSRIAQNVQEEEGDVPVKDKTIEETIQEAEKQYSGWELAEYFFNAAKRYPVESSEWEIFANKSGDIISDLL